MEQIKVLLEKLLKRYKEEPLVQWLEKKYRSSTTGSFAVEAIPPKAEIARVPQTVMFRDDAGYNGATLRRILEDFTDLSQELKDAYPERKETEAYYKCVRQFSVKVNQLLEKADTLAKGEKTARRLESCLKQTLIKVWDMGDCGPILEKHMIRWGIETKSYERGYHMSDDDLDYLDIDTLQAYQVDTDDREKEYQVIGMIHPIFSIQYLSEDEEEPEFVYIPGKCKFYCCRD